MEVRTVWAFYVRTALDTAAHIRVQALALSYHKPKEAFELLEKAITIEDSGPSAKPTGGTSKEEMVKEWENMVGGSMEDPEFRQKVYAAAAAHRKLETERAESAAMSAAKANARVVKRRRRR